MSEEQKTAADVERLQGALERERNMHKTTRAALKRLEDETLTRLDALEAAGPPLDLATVTAGLASIRADMRAEIATLRQELTELAEQLATFVRT